MPDLVIIGAGPAGLTAGIYASRALLDVEIFEKGLLGGQVATATHVENYPGFPEGIEGVELIEKMKRQAENFGAKIIFAEVKEINWNERKLVTSRGEVETQALIIASGTSPRELGVPGEKEFKGKGVSYCAVCDGAFYTDEEVVVVGGGNTAVEEALYLTKFASKVYLVHRRDSLRAEKILQERLLSNPKVEVLWNTVVREIRGDNFVKEILVEDISKGEIKGIKASGIFVYIGLKPNTSLVEGLLELDEHGFIVTNEDMETSVEGIFAAGDVRSKNLRQIATAVGDGAIAAVSAEKYIREQKGIEEAISSAGKKYIFLFDPLNDLSRKLKKEMPREDIIALDKYKHSRLISKWDVKILPVLLVFEDGKLLQKREGFSSWEEITIE
ncbi:MAG: thioredoxin-disulfide reductase [Synergistetes bacterium]|nr:thioredoxin-disulfide reductase [Synergistota bacterium]MDK2871443.1 thioredoxin reductase [bacterium]